MLRTEDKRLFLSGQLKDIVGGNFQPVQSRYARPLPVTANLKAWYDAADAATITDAGAGAVSAWSDKSGNGFTASEATNRPTTGTRTINGLNTLDFDGTNDILSSSLPADDFSQVVFAVVETDSIANIRTILGANNTGGFCLRIQNATGNLQLEKQGIAAIFNSSVPLAATTPAIVEAYLTASFAKLSQGTNVVNSGQAAHAQTATAGRTAQIGASAGALFWDGKIGEIIVYDGTLTRVQEGLILGYLSDKWGIS